MAIELTERQQEKARETNGGHATVFVDGFVDHDRSYYPHIGLVDRRFNPRPALERLIMTSAQTG